MKECFLKFFLSVFLLVSCSFHNDTDQTLVVYQLSSGKVPTSDFNDAKDYDWACLTIEGVGVTTTAWAKIDASQPKYRSVEFKIPNLLGGYEYTFKLFAVDADNINLDIRRTLSSPCPLDLPDADGWARLGKKTVETPETEDGTFVVEIPFDFEKSR